MSDILIENLDSRDYTGYYRKKVKRSKNATVESISNGRIIVHANNVTKIDEEIWNEVIAVNGGANTIKDKLNQGRLIVAGGSELSKENKGVSALREASFQRFANLYDKIQSEGGENSKDLVEHINEDGIPSFDMVRANLGDAVDGDTYNAFTVRLKKEIGNGLHEKNLTIPGSSPEPIAPPLPIATDSDNDGEDEIDYDELVETLHEKMEDIIEEDGIGKNGAPKMGNLKELGIEITRDQRDHLMNLYHEKYDEENKEVKKSSKWKSFLGLDKD